MRLDCGVNDEAHSRGTPFNSGSVKPGLCIPAKNTHHGVVVQRPRTPAPQAGNEGSNPSYVTRGRLPSAICAEYGAATNGGMAERIIAAVLKTVDV